jgi:7-cyano-7-deazaguanine synthase
MIKRFKAFVLHSGGIDSSTALALAVNAFGTDNVTSVGVHYGQRHVNELSYADEFCNYMGVKREVVCMAEPPASMLTDPSIKVPDISYGDIKGMSPTYVPFRNGQLLSRIAGIAQGWVMNQTKELELLNEPDEGLEEPQAQIWFGAHAEDAAGWAYPDCTPEFVGAMAAAIYIGSYHKVRLITPFVHSMKSEIIKKGDELDVPYYLTWSCYKGESLHCGTCPTCISRHESFLTAGVADPTKYANHPTFDR